MSVNEILDELSKLGNENTKKILLKHGAREPFFGVKIEDLKKIQKRIKKDYQLSLDLYDTGNSDAMYLAGLIADESQMTRDDLNIWVEKAYWNMLSEYTVAQITAESNYSLELANEWIKSDKENIASAGWSTLTNIVSIKQDNELNLTDIEKLLHHIEKNIHQSPNRVKYTMNGFVIAVGSFILDLTEKAIQVAQNIGEVRVDMGGTACKVPKADEYIEKVKSKGRIGKKKKKARC